MTTLVLTKDSYPYQFKSLGIRRNIQEFIQSVDFPKETEYVCIERRKIPINRS
jgi:hypothetical protein